MDKLLRLVSLCKCGVYVSINEHRDTYQTAGSRLDEMAHVEVDEPVREEMVRRDTMVVVQFYPDTPVGYYAVAHYDLETAIDLALLTLSEARDET
jgi:hypothetical protein